LAQAVPVCVVSSCVPEQIRRKLELTGLLGRFGESLFSATIVARGNRHPIYFCMPHRVSA